MQLGIYVPEILKITDAASGIYLSSYSRVLMRQFVNAHIFGSSGHVWLLLSHW